MGTELAVFILGVLAIASTLPSYFGLNKEKRVLRLLFLLGIVAQVGTQSVQYFLTLRERGVSQREADAATAVALYAYTADNIPLLRDTSKFSYLVGYRLFKDHQEDRAKAFFEESIDEGRFVASSYFMLGQIESHDMSGRLAFNSPEKDWTAAEDDLDKALENDPDYAPAYYLRASLRANTNRISGSLRDLEKAVFPRKFGRVNCENINRPDVVARDWAPLSKNPTFLSLQRKCLVLHGMDGNALAIRVTSSNGR